MYIYDKQTTNNKKNVFIFIHYTQTSKQKNNLNIHMKFFSKHEKPKKNWQKMRKKNAKKKRVTGTVSIFFFIYKIQFKQKKEVHEVKIN